VAVAVRQVERLGALQPGTYRSLVVVSADGELAVALRERLPDRLVVIRDVRPHECADALDACEPYPWMVVGEGRPREAVAAALATKPITMFWRAQDVTAPRPGVRAFHRFAELLDAVLQSLHTTVCGVSLAPGEGVLLPDGTWARSPQLEALLCAHPFGFALDPSAFRQATRLLARRGVAARVRRDAVTGHLVLRCEPTPKS